MRLSSTISVLYYKINAAVVAAAASAAAVVDIALKFKFEENSSKQSFLKVSYFFAEKGLRVPSSKSKSHPFSQAEFFICRSILSTQVAQKDLKVV